MRKTRKLWISLIALLLACMATLSMPPCSANPTTILSVEPPSIKDLTKTPGSTFTINLKVAAVSNLWGYLIFLDYDTSVLTATSFSSHPIFYLQEPSEINDAEGYVQISYHMAFGVPSGYTGTLNNMATITFTVDDYGWSWLDLRDTVFSSPIGTAIAHDEVDGFFANIEQQHAASLIGKSAWPEHHHWDESKDPDQTLFAKAKQLGNVPFMVYANFTIKDEDGLWQTTKTTDATLLNPEDAFVFSLDIAFAELPGYGKYYVKAQCWYDDGTGTFVPGGKLKGFAFSVVP